ncbi:hypothetical protein F2Q70_00038233 [Brassica cretica]|uniref:Uncharacterized protein n=1 Tax=Brassica cretica TaxID=69181 RepID=A0A8S9KDS9_BRACR|nr:hypothetical protein F2Q70_00038233 [Brassica cretica]
MNSLCPTSQSDLTRATSRGCSSFHRFGVTRSDLPERRHEVAQAPERGRHSDTPRSLGFVSMRHEKQAGSDLPERRAEVVALQLFGRTYD